MEIGFETINPDEYDFKLGELWDFDNTKRNEILHNERKEALLHN